jgi:hypothetical protein
VNSLISAKAKADLNNQNIWGETALLHGEFI